MTVFLILSILLFIGPDEGMPEVEKKEGVAQIMKWDEWMQFGSDIPTSSVEKRTKDGKAWELCHIDLYFRNYSR